MSLELFELEKTILETEIHLFRDFLVNNLKEYEIPAANVARLEEWYSELRKNTDIDIGKSMELALQETLIPNWKLIFKIDNQIDDGKTLDEQKTLLADILEDLKTTGTISTKHFTPETVKVVNRDFLNFPAKIQATIEELSAELRLCNPNIEWLDAICDRIRIAYYSVLIVIDKDKIERLLHQAVNVKKIDMSYDITNYFDDVDKYLDLEESSNVPTTIPVRQLISLFEKIKEQDALPTRKLNFFDVLSTLAIVAEGTATADDIMDIEEDLEKNKITGVIRCMDAGIPTNTIFSTLIAYLIKKAKLVPIVDKLQLWLIELLCLMYHDQAKCLEFCRSVVPDFFNVFFQRK